MRFGGMLVLVGVLVMGAGCDGVNEDVETSEPDITEWILHEGSASNDDAPRERKPGPKSTDEV